MENKMIKKLTAILMIITILSTNFFVLGSNLISYATDLNATTNNSNIEFSTYFKDESGNRVDKIEENINNQDLKMFAEIKVKNEGYFNGSIELENSNFKIKDAVSTSAISSIEENKINLNQINAGTTVELELNIEPIKTDLITSDMLSKTSTVKLTGTYKQAKRNILTTNVADIEIEAEKQITANFIEAKETGADLEAEIITNKVFAINGLNKRVVQILIKSRLAGNEYPIKQTTLSINVPELSGKKPEEIKVLSLGTKATNGKTESELNNWKNEDNKVKIIITNEPDSNGQISWLKDVYDQIVVTYIYEENVDATEIEAYAESEILVHNSGNKYTAWYKHHISNKELDGIITTELETETKDLYKGQLYANAKTQTKKEIEYKTKTILQMITNDIADKIIIKEQPDSFVTDNSELTANTKYIRTEINKAKMLEILGENGTIQIKNGETVFSVSKDSEANNDGNIVINYDNVVLSDIEITTSKPINSGTLEIVHTKAIIDSSTYTTEQLRLIKGLKIKSNVVALLGETQVVENTAETNLELKETTTKAELTINKDNLSTMTANNSVIIGVKLITNGTQYDLYKNPKIRIQMPSAVEDVVLNNSDKLYAEGFEITKVGYNKANNTIELDLKGEQTSYPITEATQIYLQLDVNIKLAKLAPSKTDKLVMTYTNENAIQYEGGTTDKGIVEKSVKITSPSGMVAINNIESHNIEAILGISANKQLADIDKNKDKGTQATFKIALINNTKQEAKNIKIVGNLPTTGEISKNNETITNTLNTVLKGVINASNCTIYYSSNINATADLNSVNNGWSTDRNSIAEVKSYMIQIPSMSAESSFEATYTVQIPEELNYDMTSYTGYTVYYNENEKVDSLLTGLSTGEGIKLETRISGTIGNDILKNGDKIKTGEVIKYRATVKNTGTQTLENIILSAKVPEGTVLVVPEAESAYTGMSYYQEMPELKEYTETIGTLAGGQEYSFEYEVRVKTDTVEGTQISNKAIATCSDQTIESSELTNIVEIAKIRVTIKKTLDDEIKLLPGSAIRYLAYVENLSNEPITDLDVNILTNGIEITSIQQEDLTVNNTTKTTIKEIPANESAYLRIFAKVSKDANEITAIVNVTDKDGRVYKSNKDVQNVEKTGAEISLSSPTQGEHIEIGDVVEYNILVKNTGTYEQDIVVTGELSDLLNIEQIFVNGELKNQTIDIENLDTYSNKISNNLSYYISVEPNQITEMQIIARVKDVGEQFESKTISTIVKAMILDEEKAKSSEVIHIVNGNIKEDVKNVISGVAWLDSNQNGQKDVDEPRLPNINVKLFNVLTNSIAKDRDGNNAETTTNSQGEYTFTRIENGTYLVLFEFDTTQYEPTTYLKEGVTDNQNSKVVLNTVTIDGVEKVYAVTDMLAVTDSVNNINMGVVDKLIFDLELDKFISRIVIQNSKQTKAYDYNDSVFEKAEIKSKYLKDSTVIIEYTIKVKNTGELAGYVTNIRDYLPTGLEFSSDLNPDWYLSETQLYTKSLANVRIEPGETKEIKLILTKAMTENNTGVINNRAEIVESYNEYGKIDIDSIENNQANNEDDLGKADILISPATGGTVIATTSLLFIMILALDVWLIAKAMRLIFRKRRGIR